MYITPWLAEKTIAIPVPKGESMPVLPVAGVQSLADASTITGSRLVDFAPDVVAKLDVAFAERGISPLH